MAENPKTSPDEGGNPEPGSSQFPTNQADATAAPGPIPLGDGDYYMSPMTAKDFGEFDRFLQASHLRMARESLDDSMPEDEKRNHMLLAHQFASRISVAVDPVSHLLAPESMARFIWLGLRRNHPELPLSEVEELVADERTLERAWDMMVQINPHFQTHGPLSGGNGLKKKTTTKKRGRRNRRGKSR